MTAPKLITDPVEVEFLADDDLILAGRGDGQFIGIKHSDYRDSVRGPQGYTGWSPVISTEVDGSRVVLRISDWTGGTGSKPAAGYLGPSGLVATIAAAVDIAANLSAAVAALGAVTGKVAKASNGSDFADATAVSSNINYKQPSDDALAVSIQDKIAADVPLNIQLDFGAVGDGVADDGPAFQKAADFGQGRPIHIPLGFTPTIKTTVHVAPIPLIDTTPVPAGTPGAFAPGLWLVGDGMAESPILCRVPNGVAFDLDVTNPTPYAYRAQQGIRVENVAFIGSSSVANSSVFKLRNAYQAKFSQCHIRGMTGSGIIMVNGDYPDDGWNMVSFEGLWIEACQQWGIDATGLVTRNEGSFTHMKHVFIQGCGRNESFRITGISNASPAAVTVSPAQIPTVFPERSAHIFVPGDRIKLWGLNSTVTLGTDPITTVNGSRVVTIADTAHGFVEGDNVFFAGAAAVGGITIAGAYQVASAPTANTFTVVHSAAASSAATGGGASVSLRGPMSGLNELVRFVGPSPTSTTFTLYQPSGAALALGSNPIAATNGSPTVTITAASHGLSVGHLVVVSEVTATGGLTIDKLYEVISVPTSGTFTITAASIATSTATGGGANVRVQRVVPVDSTSFGALHNPLSTVTINNNPFSTVSGSAVVTVTDTAHGADSTDTVTFSGATAVGGITISGEYRLTKLTADTYTITHSAPATSTAAGGGAGVSAMYYNQLGVSVPEVSYYEPQSGGLRWKGQLLHLDQCGFTVNQNCAFYVKGQSGLGIGVLAHAVTWENNYRRHVFCTGITNWRSEICQFHGNQSYKTWAGVDYDAQDFAVRGVQWVNTKVRARLGEGYAFRLAGANAAVNSCRIRTTIWDDFDYTGQKRFLGWQFDQIEEDCTIRNAGPTAVTFGPPAGYAKGNKTVLRLRGPDNSVAGGVASRTGEWSEWRMPASGATLLNSSLDDEGAAIAVNTLYNVYLYDNDGTPAIVASTVAEVSDANHGYLVKSTDSTRRWVGRVRTDVAATTFIQTSTQFLQPLTRAGSQQGVGEHFWWSPTNGGRFWQKTGTLPTSIDGGLVALKPHLEFVLTTDLASIPAGQSIEFTIPAAGVLSRDAVTDVTSSANNSLVLKGRCIADNIVVTAFNPNLGGAAAAIDAANATYTAFVIRR